LNSYFQARKQGIYKNYIQATVDRLGSIPVNNETYDVILMANGFAPGTDEPGEQCTVVFA
jgi:hypothetical protein